MTAESGSDTLGRMSNQAATPLAEDLEAVTRDSLGWIKNILSLPIDTENAALLRAQSSAAGNALNGQLRADALRLRAEKTDGTLDRLLALIRKKELLVPGKESESRSQPIGSLGAQPDGQAV